MNDSESDRMVNRAVPELAAAVIGIVLVASAAVVGCARGVGNPPLSVGEAPRPSATAADGILRTAGCATYPVAHPTEIGGTPVSGNSEIVNELNNRIFPHASRVFPDVFAQTELTDIGRLRVYRKPSSTFDAWIMRDFGNDCVEVADAKASAAEMEKSAEMITKDLRYWNSRGIEVLSVGHNPVEGVLEVEVPAKDLAQARQEIPKCYPSLQIVVVAA